MQWFWGYGYSERSRLIDGRKNCQSRLAGQLEVLQIILMRIAVMKKLREGLAKNLESFSLNPDPSNPQKIQKWVVTLPFSVPGILQGPCKDQQINQKKF